MQTKISARHGHLSTNTQTRIQEKVEKLTRIFDRLTAINVTVDLKDEDSPTVELRASVAGSDPFVATDSGPDVKSALDMALHKIEQQIRRHKEKRTGRRTTALKHLEVPADGESEGE